MNKSQGRMRSTLRRYMLWILLLGCVPVFGQEEGSAELFTESYTDRFQEVYFEALKQKGIENYDRARQHLLEAKEMDPLDSSIDHELARVLYLDKQYAEAEQHALTALRARPQQYWFLETFMEILETQGKDLEPYDSMLPRGMPEFRMNLARWYVEAGNWEQARQELSNLPESRQVRHLKAVMDSREAVAKKKAVAKDGEATPKAPEEGTVAYYEEEIERILEAENWMELEEVSGEALEMYPLQPYFYYANGISFLKQGQADRAVKIMEEGEGMLLGDSEVSQQLYRALAEAHTALGNSGQATKYLNKLKSGS